MSTFLQNTTITFLQSSISEHIKNVKQQSNKTHKNHFQITQNCKNLQNITV